jgi:hypothetical protein
MFFDYGISRDDYRYWSNYVRRDPNMDVVLKTSGATSCGHVCKGMLTTKRYIMFMASMAAADAMGYLAPTKNTFI